ncbi:MFS transporter [Kitasatospora misakiensis]|uniref:MFS transporter n=1 Tax=Kitasatospora misakiensis TaxID=67330 RepID=A0ABW0WWQ2_9ACTN
MGLVVLVRVQVLVGFGVYGVFWGTWGALVPEIQRRAGVDDGELGVAVLMIGFGALGSMRPAGAAVDRFGRSAVAVIVLLMAVAAPRPGRDWRRAPVTNRPLLALGALCALAYLVENAWQSWSAVILRSVFHTGSGAAAAGPVVFAASAAVGRLAGHGLTARLPQRHLLALGAAVAAVGTLAAALAPGVRSMLVGLVVAGLGTSVCAPTVLSLAGERARPEGRSSAVAVVASLGYGGCLLGPAVVGLTASAAGLRAALCGVAAVAAALALAALLPGPLTADAEG